MLYTLSNKTMDVLSTISKKIGCRRQISLNKVKYKNNNKQKVQDMKQVLQDKTTDLSQSVCMSNTVIWEMDEVIFEDSPVYI